MNYETIENLLVTYNRTKELISRNTKLLSLCETELDTHTLQQLIRSFEISSDILEQHLILRFTPAINFLLNSYYVNTTAYTVGLLKFHYELTNAFYAQVVGALSLIHAQYSSEYADSCYYLNYLLKKVYDSNKSTAGTSKE
jgi:hypothetical protein